MEYIGAGIFVVSFIALGCFLVVKAADEYTLMNPYSFGAFAWAVLLVAALSYAAAHEDDKGPCLRYETSMYWNAATKTMMPARVCVERAEWVN